MEQKANHGIHYMTRLKVATRYALFWIEPRLLRRDYILYYILCNNVYYILYSILIIITILYNYICISHIINILYSILYSSIHFTCLQITYCIYYILYILYIIYIIYYKYVFYIYTIYINIYRSIYIWQFVIACCLHYYIMYNILYIIYYT